jgi:hypothetical protein
MMIYGKGSQSWSGHLGTHAGSDVQVDLASVVVATRPAQLTVKP